MIDLTIIIPSYNHQDYIIQRLDTILAQTYKNWEAIIIDDSSNDDSVLLIENYLNKYPHFRVKHFIKNKLNSGSGYTSWEKGIKLSESKYIWIAESDDYSDIGFLQSCLDHLEIHNDISLVFTSSYYVDTNNNILYDSTNRTKELDVSKGESKTFEGEIIRKYFPLNPMIVNGSSVVFRKPEQTIPTSIFTHKQLSDIFLWTYLMEGKKVVFVNVLLNYFRRHENSTTEINKRNFRGNIYSELAGYINYFNLNDARVNEILSHYTRKYLIPHRKFLSIEPFKNISTSRLKLYKVIIYNYFIFLINRFFNYGKS